MSAPRDPDCRAGKHLACIGTALDEVSDTFVPCGCPCHVEHEHEWEGHAAGGNTTCRLCGALQGEAWQPTPPNDRYPPTRGPRWAIPRDTPAGILKTWHDTPTAVNPAT